MYPRLTDHRDVHGMNHRIRKTLAILLLPAAAIALYACGGKKAEDAGKGAAGGKEPVTVHLAYFPNVTHAAALVGTGDGTFAKALGTNVKVEEQTFTAGPSEIEALFAGKVDIGYIGPGPAVNGYLKSHGSALRIVAGASSGGAALVVRKDSGVTNASQLAGKKVAVPQPGGTQDISLRHALQIANLKSTDKGGTVNVLAAAPADMLTLFQKKELDAAWTPEPWVSRLVKDGNGAIAQDERDLWPGKRFATTVVIVRADFLKEHPDIVASFLKAHIAAVDWIGSHQPEAAKLISERIKTLTGKALPADIVTGALTRTDFTYDPLKESVLTFADWSHDLGYLKEGRSGVSGLIDTGPLNTALTELKKPTIN
jgi:NitT/TauT family transport system substrate-binding protein